VTMTAIRALAEFVATTGIADLPADVVARGSLILADCVGCMVAGSTAPEVRRLLALEAGRGEPCATVLGTPTRLAMDAAAYINGTAGTWHDLDEGNLSTRTHAAIQIAPAALAEAEARSLPGDRLLEAIILAYEASARLWRATDSRLAVHPHGTYGPLAAALALAKLRDDDASAIEAAANIAMTLGIAASRNTLNDGATVRNIYSGHSGRAGFQALALRDAGFTGEADAAASILGKIYGSAFDPAAVTADLNSTWWIRRNYFKRYAAGRYAHGALDLIDDLAVKLGVGLLPERVERIEIETFFLAATLGQQHVRTPFGCRFSIPMLVSQRIAHGSVPLTDDSTRAFADPVVRELAGRVFVSENETATALYPDRQCTRMTLILRGGGTHSVASEVILGESDRPFPAGVLEAKFTSLSEASWGDVAATAWRDLNRITNIPDVGRLLEGWRTASRSL
jgi:2-methylcitrate dehydratase PrpD